MPSSVKMRGDKGELRVGYEVAAQLGDWSLQQQAEDSFIVRAKVVKRDAFWIDQGPPYDLRLNATATQQWCWADVDVARGDNGQITIYGRGAATVRR